MDAMSRPNDTREPLPFALMGDTSIPPYDCRKCHMPVGRLMSRCPSCGSMWTIAAKPKTVRADDAERTAAVLSSTNATESDVPRVSTGFAWLDPVFGGGLDQGIAVGSINLLWGEAGLGKTTLLMQLARHVGTDRVLLVQSEQPAAAVMSTIARLGAKRAGFDVVATDDVKRAVDVIKSQPYGLVIIDSLQGLCDTGHESGPGSVSQGRRIGRRLVSLAHDRGITMLITNHVISSGRQAGGTYNVHGVDGTFELSGDIADPNGVRVLRTLKNRNGGPRIARMRMTERGLEHAPEVAKVAPAASAGATIAERNAPPVGASAALSPPERTRGSSKKAG